MKTITDIIFPKKFKTEAEEYIAYKRSLGFKFSMDDQRKLLYMLNHIYIYNHNDVTHLTKDAVDSFLSLSNGSKPRTLHANQSFIRQYGLYLLLNGYDSYIYPDKLIQCPKDFVPYIFTKEEIHSIFLFADRIGPNKNKFINTPFIYPAVFRLLYACGTRVGETLSLKTDDVNPEEGIITLYNGKIKSHA